MSQMVTKNNEMPGNSGKEEHNVESKELDGSETSTNDASAMTATVPTAVDVDEATAKNLVAADTATSPKVENKKIPTKRTPSKRLSFIERAQKESEELVKNLGGSLELEGGRRTRSSTRGTSTRSAIVATPPPVKKARASPATSATPTTPRRGRGRKIDISKEPVEKQLTLDENKTTSDATEEETTNNEKNDSKNASIEKSGDNSIENVPNKTASSELSENVEEITSVSDAEDKTDAAALEVIPEENQNNVDHCSESTEDRNGCNTLAEYVEVSKSLNASEDIAAPTQKKNVEMEPLPEPMETDSTICSNTIEPRPTTAESVESDGEISRNSIETSSVVDPVTVQNISDAQISKDSSTAEVSNPEITKDAEPVTTVSEIVEEEKMDESSAANDTQEMEAANDLADIEASSEPQATTKQATIAIPEDTTKSGNDLCEPKIVSPAATDEAVAATPQFCN